MENKINAIIDAVASDFNVSREDILSRTRKQPIAEARQVAVYLVRRYCKLPVEQIGFFFGRNHSTIVHAIKTIKDHIDINIHYGFKIVNIYNSITELVGNSDRLKSKTK